MGSFSDVLLLRLRTGEDEGENCLMVRPRSKIEIGRLHFSSRGHEDSRLGDVSRSHCTIAQSGEAMVLYDHSQNGTTLIRAGQDPQRLDRDSVPVVIETGDVLALGRCARVIIEKYEPDPQKTSPPAPDRQVSSGQE